MVVGVEDREGIEVLGKVKKVSFSLYRDGDRTTLSRGRRLFSCQGSVGR